MLWSDTREGVSDFFSWLSRMSRPLRVVLNPSLSLREILPVSRVSAVTTSLPPGINVALNDYVVFHLNDEVLPVQLAHKGRKVGIIKLKHIQPAISFGQGTCPRPPTDASLLLQPQSHAETTEVTVCNLVRRPFGCRRRPVYECRHQPERVSF